MKTRTSILAGAVGLVVALAAEGCSQTSAIDEPGPPPNQNVQDGGSPSEGGYQVLPGDPEMPGTIQTQNDAGTSDFQLIGIRSSDGGKRRLVLRRNGEDTIIAPSDWNLPPVAGLDLDGKMLICWNRLIGPEPGADMAPSPSSGLGLFCRFRRTDGSLTSEVRAADSSVPCWFRSVEIFGAGAFGVTFIRNQTGRLFGDPRSGDGIFSQQFDGELPGQTTTIRQL